MFALLLAAAVGASAPAPLLPAWALVGEDGKPRIPAAALEAISASRDGALPRRVVGHVRGSDGPVAGVMVVAMPRDLRLFAQHDELGWAPPAVTMLAPGWEALRDAGAVVTAVTDPEGAFALDLDDRAWIACACETSAWCTQVAAVTDAPLELVARRQRIAAVAVVDDSGAPLAGASVIARHARSRWDDSPQLEYAKAITDASGRVLLARLPPQPLTVEASAPGHAAVQRTPAGEGALTFVLPRSATVTVRLLGDGPLRDARAVLLRPADDAPSAWVASSDEVAADSEGAVTLRDVPPGRTVIEARAHGFLPARSAPLDVRPAQVLDAGAIALTPGAFARGVVRDALEEQPIADATIVVVGRKDLTATSGADGRFELGPLTPGTWMLHAMREGYPESSASDVAATVGAEADDVDDLAMALVPGGDLTVRVRDAAGAGIAGVRVVLNRASPSLHVRDQGALVTDARGEAAWVGIEAGHVTLRLLGCGAASAAGADMMARMMAGPAPGTTAEGDVVAVKKTIVEMTVPGVRLFGTVTVDGVPTEARVRTSGSGFDGMVKQAPAPDYTLAGLSPGVVELQIDTPLDGGWQRFAQSTERVTIPEGVTGFRHDIALKAPPPGDDARVDGVRVPGVLRDAATREPLGGWTVEAIGVTVATTNVHGEFALLLPRHGSVALSAHPAGADDASLLGPSSAALVIMIDGTVASPGSPLILEAIAGPMVTVRVVDRLGLPVSGAWCAVASGERPGGGAREARTDPTGRAVLRVASPGDVPVLVTDGASFATITTPVAFGSESERVVTVPPTGAVHILSADGDVAIQCAGWPSPMGVVSAWRWGLQSMASVEGGMSATFRGVPVGECDAMHGERRVRVAVTEGATVEADLR